MGAAELVDHLEATHHRYLWEEMPRLSALMAKVVAVHGERHPELHAIAACYEEVRADLEPHLAKEEQVLFPMIRELATAPSLPSFHCGTLRNPISVMLREHDAVGELLAELRRLTNGYLAPADGCASYVTCFAALAELEADTHLHIHKENNLLFPLVTRMEANCSEPADDDAGRGGRRGGLLGCICSSRRCPISVVARMSSSSYATSTGRRRWTTCSDRCSPRPG